MSFTSKSLICSLREKVKKELIHNVAFEKYWKCNDFDSDIFSINKWCGREDEDAFRKIKIDSSIEDIDYHNNRYGFRTSPESNNVFRDNLIACFGCSNTYGIGVTWGNTWPNILNQQLGNDWSVKNYGVCGASNDMISRLIFNYTLYNSPKIICCFFPSSFRTEIFAQGEFENFKIGGSNDFLTPKESLAYATFLNYENAMYNFIKNFKMIESICNNKNIKLYWFSWCGALLSSREMLKNILNSDGYLRRVINVIEEFSIPPLARDGIHYGKNFNLKLATKFYEKIKG